MSDYKKVKGYVHPTEQIFEVRHVQEIDPSRQGGRLVVLSRLQASVDTLGFRGRPGLVNKGPMPRPIFRREYMKTYRIFEAWQLELERCPIIAPMKPDDCHVCGRCEELRCGVCFECKDLVLTDLKEVWEIDNPSNRWTYQYRSGEIDLD